jgi:hypothetical protein
MSRRATARAVVMLLAASALNAVAFTAPARAVDPLPPTFSADPLPTWQTNGTVWALETIGNVVYVGGSFTKVRPPGAAEGAATEVGRVNFAAFNATTGDLLSCNPTITNSAATAKVFAIEASPSGDRLYVGGTFSTVSGSGVASLVALNPSTCALVPSSTFRRPNMSASVRSIAATSTNVYVGGEFSSVDSQPRTRFAGFTSGGTLLLGSVTLDGNVRTVLAAPDYGKVMVGGEFNTVNGTTNKGLVAVDPATLEVVRWYPGLVPPNSVPKALARDDTSFYMGDEGNGYGQFDGRMALDLATGDLKWQDWCLGATQTLAVDNGVLYGGHHAHECQVTPGGWLEDGIRNHLTAQDVRDRTIIPTFFPDTDDGIGVAPLGPRAMVVAQDQLWVGGEFSEVNDASQRGLTRFGRPDTGATSAPTPTVTTPRVGMNVLSWIAAFDRDDDVLKYEVYKNDVLVDTISAQSRQWTRRQLSYVDRDVSAGEVAKYRLRVVEADGGNAGSKGAQVTVTSATSSTSYPGTVLGDSPQLYWRLDESAEQDARTRTGVLYYRGRMLDSSGNSRQATAERGYTTVSPDGYSLGAPSALAGGSGSSVRFSGTTGRIAEGFTNDFVPVKAAPPVYTMELWFKTAGTTGGRLAGFGDRRTELFERTPPGSAVPVSLSSLSTDTDRLLYINDSGKISFGTRDGAAKVTIKSANSYNDQQWHYVAASSGSAGMRLYVDGVRVASGTSTANLAYNGYWKLGYDSLSGWPDRPASGAIKADLDEFAVYGQELAANQVAAHYIAGRPDAVIDLEAPTAPSGLSLSRTGQTVEATWTPGTDNVGVAGYTVYRTATPDAPLNAAAQVGTPTGTSFSEAGVAEGTWYYRVTTRDAAGNESEPTSPSSVAVPKPPLTLSVTPAADSYVNSALATTSYGSSTTLIADSDPRQYGMMRFVLPTAPSGMVLTSAALRVRTGTASSASSIDSHRIRTGNNSWTESTVTWNSRPDVGTDTLGTLPAGTAVNTAYEVPLDVTKIASYLGSQRTFTVDPEGPDSVVLQTREAATANRPTLLLNFDSLEPGPTTTTTTTTTPPTTTTTTEPTTDPTTTTTTTDPVTTTTTTTTTAPVTVTTLTPTADTYVNFGAKSTNYGTSTSMIADSDTLQYSLLRFVLPSAPAGKVLTAATLTVHTTSATSASSADSHSIVIGADDWAETVTTWNTRPAIGSTQIGKIPAGSAINQTYNVSLEVGAVADLLGQQSTLAVKADGPDSIVLVTREGTSSSRPQLTLTFGTP